MRGDKARQVAAEWGGMGCCWVRGNGLLLNEGRWVVAEWGEMGCCWVKNTRIQSTSLTTHKIRKKWWSVMRSRDRQFWQIKQISIDDSMVRAWQICQSDSVAGLAFPGLALWKSVCVCFVLCLRKGWLCGPTWEKICILYGMRRVLECTFAYNDGLRSFWGDPVWLTGH